MNKIYAPVFLKFQITKGGAGSNDVSLKLKKPGAKIKYISTTTVASL